MQYSGRGTTRGLAPPPLPRGTEGQRCAALNQGRARTESPGGATEPWPRSSAGFPGDGCRCAGAGPRAGPVCSADRGAHDGHRMHGGTPSPVPPARPTGSPGLSPPASRAWQTPPPHPAQRTREGRGPRSPLARHVHGRAGGGVAGGPSPRPVPAPAPAAAPAAESADSAPAPRPRRRCGPRRRYLRLCTSCRRGWPPGRAPGWTSWCRSRLWCSGEAVGDGPGRGGGGGAAPPPPPARPGPRGRRRRCRWRLRAGGRAASGRGARGGGGRGGAGRGRGAELGRRRSPRGGGARRGDAGTKPEAEATAAAANSALAGGGRGSEEKKAAAATGFGPARLPWTRGRTGAAPPLGTKAKASPPLAALPRRSRPPL